MSIVKYILKVFGTQILSAFVLMLMSPLLLISESTSFQTIIGVVMMGFYWVFVCLMLEKSATMDVKNGTYSMIKPLIAGIVTITPSLILMLLDIVLTNATGQRDQLALLLFRAFNSGYMNFLIMYQDAIWLMCVVMVANVGIVCFSYYRARMIDDKHKRFMDNLNEEMKNVHRAVDLPPEEDNQNE